MRRGHGTLAQSAGLQHACAIGRWWSDVQRVGRDSHGSGSALPLCCRPSGASARDPFPTVLCAVKKRLPGTGGILCWLEPEQQDGGVGGVTGVPPGGSRRQWWQRYRRPSFTALLFQPATSPGKRGSGGRQKQVAQPGNRENSFNNLRPGQKTWQQRWSGSPWPILGPVTPKKSRRFLFPAALHSLVPWSSPRGLHPLFRGVGA